MENEKKAKENKLIEEFEGNLKKRNLKQGDLIKVLHEAQNIFGYIPEKIQIIIANQLDVFLSEVTGVIGFYSYFTTKPKGKYSVSVCMGTACYVKGAGKILDKFKNTLEIEMGQTTEDGIFSLEECRCLGACGLAPVITINESVHGKITENDVEKIIEEYRNKDI